MVINIVRPAPYWRPYTAYRTYNKALQLSNPYRLTLSFAGVIWLGTRVLDCGRQRDTCFTAKNRMTRLPNVGVPTNVRGHRCHFPRLFAGRALADKCHGHCVLADRHLVRYPSVP